MNARRLKSVAETDGQDFKTQRRKTVGDLIKFYFELSRNLRAQNEWIVPAVIFKILFQRLQK